MTLAIVQTSGLIRFSNVSGAQTFHMPSGNFTAGNVGVLTIVAFNNGVPITSVSIGGTVATRRALGATDSVNSVEIWVAEGMAGGSDAVVITGGTGYYYSGGCIEVSGAASPAFDVANTSSLTNSAAPSVATGTLGQPDELVVAAFVQCDGAAPTINNPPAGYTAIFEEEDGTNEEPGAGCYKIVSSTTSVVTTWALGSAQVWQAATVTIKQGAASAAPEASLFFGSGSVG